MFNDSVAEARMRPKRFVVVATGHGTRKTRTYTGGESA